jgi:hypothetical protein
MEEAVRHDLTNAGIIIDGPRDLQAPEAKPLIAGT